MKKILILSLLMLSFNFALATDYTSYCSTSTANKTLAGNVASLTGYNALNRAVIKGQIKKAIKKATGTNPELQLESYYGTNIKNGEFSNLTGSIKEFQYKGMNYSTLDFNSLCSYNKVRYIDKALQFDENFVMNFKGTITQKDLNKYISSSEYKKALNSVNNNQILSNLFKIEDGEVEIGDNKLTFNYKINPLPKTNSHLDFIKNFIKPVNLSFSSGLKIENGEIKLCDVNLNNTKISSDYILPFINMTNPTNFEAKVDKKNTGSVEIQNVEIKKGVINLGGVMLIKKTGD